jgi:hypothetical protein
MATVPDPCLGCFARHPARPLPDRPTPRNLGPPSGGRCTSARPSARRSGVDEPACASLDADPVARRPHSVPLEVDRLDRRMCWPARAASGSGLSCRRERRPDPDSRICKRPPNRARPRRTAPDAPQRSGASAAVNSAGGCLGRSFSPRDPTLWQRQPNRIQAGPRLCRAPPAPSTRLKCPGEREGQSPKLRPQGAAPRHGFRAQPCGTFVPRRLYHPIRPFGLSERPSQDTAGAPAARSAGTPLARLTWQGAIPAIQTTSDRSPPGCRRIRPSSSRETSSGATCPAGSARSRISWSSATGLGPSRSRIRP